MLLKTHRCEIIVNITVLRSQCAQIIEKTVVWGSHHCQIIVNTTVLRSQDAQIIENIVVLQT